MKDWVPGYPVPVGRIEKRKEREEKRRRGAKAP
jgi:hypothetical protein